MEKLVISENNISPKSKALNLYFKIVSYLGQLLSVGLLLCTLGVCFDDYVTLCVGNSQIKNCILIILCTYFVLNSLYVYIFGALHFSGYLSFMKILHTVLICIVFVPFVNKQYHLLSFPIESIFCLAPVALTIDLLCVYLLYKKHCNKFMNNYHVLPKMFLYTLAIYDQITQSYVLLEFTFLFLFVTDLIFFFQFRNYNFWAERKLDLMKLQEYTEA